MFKIKTLIILLLVMQLQSAFVYYKSYVKAKNETLSFITTSTDQSTKEDKVLHHTARSMDYRNAKYDNQEFITDVNKEYISLGKEYNVPYYSTTTSLYEMFMRGVVKKDTLTGFEKVYSKSSNYSYAQPRTGSTNYIHQVEVMD